ncbi:hypothetical protein AF383_24275 [Salmonella enterica subsp. enterica serovar Typhimurium]|nr:hypothetical protein AF383_24275 [Salmonella enterica subsp. enterica serovar Typhimurium]
MRLITPQQPMKKMRQGFVRRVNVCGILRQGDFSVMKKNHNRQANWQMNQQRLKQWNRTQLNIIRTRSRWRMSHL